MLKSKLKLFNCQTTSNSLNNEKDNIKRDIKYK